MIGGVVIETITLPDRIWINCEEEQSTSQCAIYVKRSEKSEKVARGDTVWWQGRWAMWTPFKPIIQPVGVGGRDYDIKLERIGCSGVSRPPEALKGL